MKLILHCDSTDYVFAAISMGIFLLSVFWWGRLSKAEILKRTLYQQHAGIYANPDDLPVSLKTSIYALLAEKWEELADPDSPWTLSSEPWIACRKVIKTDLEHYGLAYTMGRYAGATEEMDILWALVMASIAYEFRES